MLFDITDIKTLSNISFWMNYSFNISSLLQNIHNLNSTGPQQSTNHIIAQQHASSHFVFRSLFVTFILLLF